MSKAIHQKPEQTGRADATRGEALREAVCDATCDPPREHPGTGSAKQQVGAGGLLATALTLERS